MTILIVLLGLMLSHYLALFGRWRSFEWLLWPVRQLENHPGRPAVRVVLVIVLMALVCAWLLTALFYWLPGGLGRPLLARLVCGYTLGPGGLGRPLLALLVFVYTLGPRDLDRDVKRVLDEAEDFDGQAAARLLGVANADSPAAAGAAVMRTACTRWFAVVFWFVLLGIVGALLYRFCQQAILRDRLSAAELDWLRRLRRVLEWPVLLLMMLTLGLVTDLDRIAAVWKNYHRKYAWWAISPRLLEYAAAAALADADSIADGVRRGHQLAWRMLVLWLAVMSLMLIAGWIN